MNLVLVLFYMFFNLKQCNSVVFVGDWTDAHKELVYSSVYTVGERLAKGTDLEPCEAFDTVFGRMTFITGYENIHPTCRTFSGACMLYKDKINVISFPTKNKDKTSIVAKLEGRNLIIHELGHSFFWSLSNVPENLIDKDGFLRVKSARLMWNQHPCSTEVKESNCYKEVMADMFLGWVFEMWADDDYGMERHTYMRRNMPTWLHKRLIGDNNVR